MMSERRRIYRTARNAQTARTITEFFDGLGKCVFIRSELVRLIDKHREQWALVQNVSSDEVIDDSTESLPLRRFALVGGNYTNEFQRYAWRDPDPLEVAASIPAPKSYLCDSSALFMHKLVDHLPRELYFNYEQSDKPKPSGELSQEALDRAFRGKQRQSANSCTPFHSQDCSNQCLLETAESKCREIDRVQAVNKRCHSIADAAITDQSESVPSPPLPMRLLP
jgi:hypothetical protein